MTIGNFSFSKLSKPTKDFLKDCLNSVKDTKYPIIVLSNGGYKPDLEIIGERRLIVNPINGWELAGIQAGKDNFDDNMIKIVNELYGKWA